MNKDFSPVKFAAYQILNGNILISNETVLVKTKYSPGDSTDCITMQLASGG